MKKIIFRIIALTILAALAAGMVACGNGSIYDDLAKDGFTVKVRYEADGAVVNETQNVTIVEVFNADDKVTVNGKSGVALLDPSDTRRGEGVFKLAKTDGKNNYYLAGWYTSRTPRVGANGEALDAYGVPIATSGREQGYVFSGKWDFEKDVVTSDMAVDGEFVLYAAWVPFFTYEFYATNENGETELLGQKNKLTLTLPKWNDRKEQYDMKDFPKEDGKVFAGAYLDEAMTREISVDLDGREYFIDYEKGIAAETTVKVYVKWAE